MRAKAWEAAKNFLDTHGENGVLNADDAATYDKMEQDISKYTADIERLKRAKEIEDQMSKPVNTPLLNDPKKLNDKPVKKGRASDEYRHGFVATLRTNFRKISDVLTEGVAEDGGYLVPEEWDSRLIDAIGEESIMRKLATVITTNGTHKINVAGSKPAAAWYDEGEALTWGDAKFGQVQLDAFKLAVAVKVSEELVYDNAYNLEGYLQQAFASAIADAEEEKFMTGVYSENTPTGIFDTTAGGITEKTLTAAMKADDIMDLVYALERKFRPKAQFIMNDKIVAAVRKLKDGNGAYMWQPSYQAGEPDKLLGYALNTSTQAPETAIAFGDYSYYNIGDRGIRYVSELKELFAGNGLIGYVAKERVDGILTLRDAVQILRLPE